jgi:hypothetical protein
MPPLMFRYPISQPEKVETGMSRWLDNCDLTADRCSQNCSDYYLNVRRVPSSRTDPGVSAAQNHMDGCEDEGDWAG